MRVLRSTADEMVIEEKPWFLGLLLGVFVLGFAAAALAAAFEGSYGMTAVLALVSLAMAALGAFVVERVWLVLDRGAGTVELRRRNARGYRRQSYPLASLKGVELQSDFGDGTRTYRLVLRLSGQAAPVPVTRYFQSGRNTEACAKAAQAWLAAAADASASG